MKDPQNSGKRFERILRGVLVLSILFSLTIAVALGQTGGSASLYGTVTDASGAAVPSVKVTATNLGTNVSWTTVSDASGNFDIPDLPIGQYRLDAEATGFAEFEVTGVSVAVAQNTRVEVVMKVGTTKQTVMVTSGAPVVDTQSAGLKGTVDRQFIDQLPLIDRNVSVLETVEAGTGTDSSNTLVVNGNRGGHNEYVLNGLTLNNPQFTQVRQDPTFPNPDAVQEFTVVKNGYEAQYGRNESGQVIVATRSGTNHLHGSLFEYLRNFDLDSRSFFAVNKTPYRRNIFGGSAGGPIRKDKLFFFGSYQGTRQAASPNAGVENTVPTQAQRNGDFSAQTKPIIDPTTGQPFPGNIIPTNRVSSISQNLLTALVPLPNGPNGQIIYAPPGTSTINQGVAKIDAVLSAKDRLSGSYFINRNTTVSNTNLPILNQSIETPFQEISLNETHSFGPHLLNDFTLGGLHYGYNQTPDVPGSPTMNTYGSNYYIPSTGHSLSLSVSGNLNVNDGVPSIRPAQFYQLLDNLHWIHGNHSFAFGGSMNRGKTWTSTLFRQGGAFTFSGFASGTPVADFMLGLASQFIQITGAYLPRSGQDYSFYAQDTWRATRDLTLNVGLRWTPTFFEKSLNGQNLTFLRGEQSIIFPGAPRGLVYQGDPGVPSDGSYHTPFWDVLEPRVGIAWTPFGHSSWVVRSSFGEFHLPMMVFVVGNNSADPYVATTTVTAPPNFANPYQGIADPFPFTRVVPSAPLAQRQAVPFFLPESPGEFFDPSAKIPTTLQWNFTIEHQLGPASGIELAYVGTHSYRQFIEVDPNPPLYIPGTCGAQPCSTGANEQSRRPLTPGFGIIYTDFPIGYSNYNALQMTYRHQAGYGLTFLANYTYSRVMDLGQDVDQNSHIIDPFNVRSLYGPAGYDIRHVFKISYAWNLPWFASGGGIAGHFVRGWTFSGIARAGSGLPLNISSGVDNSLTGYGLDHANQIGSWQLSGGRSRGQQVQEWFNTQAFTVNPIGTFGNVGQNSVRAPGAFTFDMSIFRAFRLGEQFKLEYRLDASNIFNHTVLTAVNGTASSSAFGAVTSTGNPRILQMALRLTF